MSSVIYHCLLGFFGQTSGGGWTSVILSNDFRRDSPSPGQGDYFMKLTRASSYALYAMIHMAGEKSKLPLASHEVAKEHDIPERFLLKVLKPLVSAGILVSVKGPRGGYRLARKPNEITMLDVIEAVEGPIRGMAAFHSDTGSSALKKKIDSVCSNAAQHTRRYLDQVKLSQLAGL